MNLVQSEIKIEFLGNKMWNKSFLLLKLTSIVRYLSEGKAEVFDGLLHNKCFAKNYTKLLSE